MFIYGINSTSSVQACYAEFRQSWAEMSKTEEKVQFLRIWGKTN